MGQRQAERGYDRRVTFGGTEHSDSRPPGAPNMDRLVNWAVANGYQDGAGARQSFRAQQHEWPLPVHEVSDGIPFVATRLQAAAKEFSVPTHVMRADAQYGPDPAPDEGWSSGPFQLPGDLLEFLLSICIEQGFGRMS
jgi:hypothetical protein